MQHRCQRARRGLRLQRPPKKVLYTRCFLVFGCFHWRAFHKFKESKQSKQWVSCHLQISKKIQYKFLTEQHNESSFSKQNSCKQKSFHQPEVRNISATAAQPLLTWPFLWSIKKCFIHLEIGAAGWRLSSFYKLKDVCCFQLKKSDVHEVSTIVFQFAGGHRCVKQKIASGQSAFKTTNIFFMESWKNIIPWKIMFSSNISVLDSTSRLTNCLAKFLRGVEVLLS